MANLTLPEGTTNAQVALLAAALLHAERGGSYGIDEAATRTAQKFLKFLETGQV